MAKPEEIFSELLQSVGQDARACVLHAYSELTIQQHAADNPDVSAALNRDAGFWNAVLNAHQTAAFLALGRLYDNTKGTTTLGSLVEMAESHSGLFTRKSLAERKQAGGMSAADAAVYVADAFEPGKTGFAAIRRLHDDEKKEYEQKAGKIRHEVFAHKVANTREEQQQRFKDLLIRDFERLVLTPYRIQNALWELFVNGYEPTLPDMPSNISDVIAARPARRVVTWQHLHVASRVITLLDSLLTRAPADPNDERW